MYYSLSLSSNEVLKFERVEKWASISCLEGLKLKKGVARIKSFNYS